MQLRRWLLRRSATAATTLALVALLAEKESRFASEANSNKNLLDFYAGLGFEYLCLLMSLIETLPFVDLVFSGGLETYLFTLVVAFV